MAWMDEFYDPLAGYLFDTTGTTPLRHETRQSVFYALGLLARNQNDDLEQAYKIFYNTISKQFTDPSQPQYVYLSFLPVSNLLKPHINFI
jgi:hypothetical protein